MGDGVPIDRRPGPGSRWRRPAILFALLLLATPSPAATVASRHEPTPRETYDERWASSVRYCARTVAKVTERPVAYQVGFAGSVPRYTDDRQERLMWACFDALGVRP